MIQHIKRYFQSRLKQAYYWFRLIFGDKEPVIVYQMGKVGSSTVAKSLAKQIDNPVLHVHRMSLNNIENVEREHKSVGKIPPDETVGILLHKLIIKKKKPAKIITLVREPVERNMSAFFQNYERFVGQRYNKDSKDIEMLVHQFFESYNHNVPLTWFDIEMKTVLGVDVYQYPFPKDKGYLTINKPPYEVLILKIETDDAVKQEAVRKFLNMDEFVMTRQNVGGEKEYSKTYSDFKKNIIVPDDYVDKMCKSKYIKHFYDSKEIQEIRQRWIR